MVRASVNSNVSGAFPHLAFGEPPTSVEGTRDHSTDFFLSRYLKCFPALRLIRGLCGGLWLFCLESGQKVWLDGVTVCFRVGRCGVNDAGARDGAREGFVGDEGVAAVDVGADHIALHQALSLNTPAAAGVGDMTTKITDHHMNTRLLIIPL